MDRLTDYNVDTIPEPQDVIPLQIKSVTAAQDGWRAVFCTSKSVWEERIACWGIAENEQGYVFAVALTAGHGSLEIAEDRADYLLILAPGQTINSDFVREAVRQVRERMGIPEPEEPQPEPERLSHSGIDLPKYVISPSESMKEED